MAGGPQENTLLHLFAGGCGGTVGAIFTCPLEVIKTRLQSSKLAFRTVYYPQVQLGTISGEGVVRPTSVSPGLLSVLKSILEKEGPRSLFRGLGPNLVGVAPSRAVYFACYSKAKEQFNSMFVPNSNIVHVCSAGSAAFITNSLMNPIWMVKTRMQLERKVRGSKPMNALQCARYVYQTEGIRGFYRGLTASYAGISETIICFAIYEKDLHKLLCTDGCCCYFQGLCLLHCLSSWYVNPSPSGCSPTAAAWSPRQVMGLGL
uniref:Solute carrier family 25 member 33 n=1 Tax=Catharus ustulatus TaxID=91951 RepID=A0A8C3UI47_CATUS